MTNKQKNFYNIMHVFSTIGFIISFVGILFLLYAWIMNATHRVSSYHIDLGGISFDLPQQLIDDQFTVNHLFFIVLLIILGLTAWLLFNLIKIFKNLKNEHVFVQENARYIQYIGWIIIVLSFIKDLPNTLQVWVFRHYLDDILTSSYSINYEPSIGLLFSGLAILAVAQIYKQAVKIAEENDLTI